MQRKENEEPISTKITTREYSVEERTRSIRQILKTRGKVEFFDLFEFYSKPYVIVTFLSILEMARKNEIKITQEGNFDKIYSSCKFKLKDCVIYVDKYMIRTKVFVTDDFHFTSVTPGWQISRYYKNKYLLYELEPMHQLPILKNEIIKVR